MLGLLVDLPAVVKNVYLEAPPVLPLLVALGILGVLEDQEAPVHPLIQSVVVLYLDYQEDLEANMSGSKIKDILLKTNKVYKE